jgi:Asp-tRNA(Asn)/Glu-tRNA(Gln) amidotransferase A subunit family amidase
MARSEGFVAAHDTMLSIAGPLARNAADLAVLTEVGAQHPLPRNPKPIRECRLLALTDYPGSPLDDSVRIPTEAALAALENAGIAIDRDSDLVPDLARQHSHYLKMMNVVMARGAPAPNGTRATLPRSASTLRFATRPAIRSSWRMTMRQRGRRSCSTAITTCSPSIRWSCGTPTRSNHPW